MDLELDGRVVIVTGGSDGLGLALAQRLVDEGARVTICGRSQERLDSAAQQLGNSDRVLAVRADVSSSDDVCNLVSETAARWGAIHGLVNNAGVAAAVDFMKIPDEDWEYDLDHKVKGAIRTCREVIPHLTDGGSIVNVLSVAAKTPGPRSMPSSLSRAAGLAFTKVLSKEFGASGIRVNAIMVGLIESAQWQRQAAAKGITVEEQYAELSRTMGIPLGRVGKSEEFADLAAFLLSPRAGYVSGTAINCDGGLCSVS